MYLGTGDDQEREYKEGMGKVFREWKIEEQMLFPPSVLDLVPPGHMAHFIRNVVMEHLDLSGIVDNYQEERGHPPYHPVMMTALLLYGYSQRVYSSRRIAEACEQRVDFMAVTGRQNPNFHTISEFRRRHLKELGKLFGQVLRLCRKAGMAKLSHVALDGTRIRANASKSG
jgi:transposase